MNELIFVIFQLAVLLFSVIVHEVAHGVVALRFGDPTAKYAGRLTLNPSKHLDPVGSFFLPLFMLFVTQGRGPILGWAKPVPYNPMHLKNPRRAAGLIALAGPLSNIALAVAFGVLLRILPLFPFSATTAALGLFFSVIISINVLLAIFNLLPLPPLDGSKVLFAVLPHRYRELEIFLTRYGFIVLLFIIFFGFTSFIGPVIDFVYRIIAGSAATF
ncbi:MAG: site-2 protease family protein [Candidatus Harrisonbacteria bacterium CG10_big_fil_rev_8_21_14_0_10_42_17]|uniref:Site-2 protease family protein n=1 Tax=Candidatus Harrisonbacteria bacterium CG10_big_fil_rev_8_21_14_0_10_42_17 TaxID=1974584 RepID=A0A2M6WHJ3_9BACT|nr:MAG: site-2 protease family protein [Candidatus Harrisonbacteria bacterium CG10_big_fil_rev_8_21_14_0_10_42_17]